MSTVPLSVKEIGKLKLALSNPRLTDISADNSPANKALRTLPSISVLHHAVYGTDVWLRLNLSIIRYDAELELEFVFSVKVMLF